MSWWQIHHWEKTLQLAQQYLAEQEKLGYNGEIKPDGNDFLILTWRI